MSQFEEYTLMVRQTDSELFEAAPEERYVARLKEIPENSLYEYGETQQDAIAKLKIQFDLMREEFQARKLAFPQPEKRPIKQYSGRLVLRMPSWLHERVANNAEAEKASINCYIVDRLIDTTSAEDLYESFCRFQQRTIDQVAYNFNWTFSQCSKRHSLPSNIFKLYSSIPTIDKADKTERELENVG